MAIPVETPPEPAVSNASVAWRAALSVGVAVVFPLLAFRAPYFIALSSWQEHVLLDLGVALSACFCGLQALVRYEARPHPLFLWFGAAFIGSGLLGGVHVMAGLQQPAGTLVDAPLVSWSWLASALMLATCLALGLARSGPLGAERQALTSAPAVGGVTAAVLVVLVTLLLLAPLPTAYWAELPLHRPFELAPAAVMGVAFALAWQRRDHLDPTLRRVVFPALTAYITLHAGVMAWSALPLDRFVGVSHLAAILAHWLILVGLLQSSVSLLKQAEESRRRVAAQTEVIEANERRIRSIVEHAPYAILAADESGLVRNINPFAADVFGVTAAAAIGRPLISFFDASLHEHLAQKLGGEHAMRARILQRRHSEAGEDATRSRRALSQQARGIRADGSTFPIALTLTDAVAGGQRFFTAFVRDLTRIIEQEEKVQHTLNLATGILDQSGVAICSTDSAGLITRFNRTAQQWFGYSEQEVCGRLTPAALVDRHELDRQGDEAARQGQPPATIAEILLGPVRRGGPTQREWTLVRKDGSHFPGSVAIAPLADPSGEVTGFVVVANDLSRQKEVEHLKNEFVSTVSHELRTPLTSVRGSLGLIAGGLAGKMPPQAKTLLDIAQRNTERLILLINDILDIEKIEAGKLRFNLKLLDLNALAADAIQSAEGLAATRSVRLVWRERRPGSRVYADEHRLLQVMANLLSNAIKFSHEGGVIEVDVTLAEERARFTVTDHGTGIPEASQPRIFQKFFQADSTNTREKSGTGLGLSICKALVERMDGAIGFRSQAGETVFHFELPHATTTTGSATGRRVLVVEDDTDTAAVLCQILGQTGIETDTARDAATARDLLQKRRYDCMTLDVLLPDQNGMALLGEVRRQEYGRQLPIIIVSIYEADAANQAAAAAARVEDWLIKPIDSARLLAAVRRALRLAPEGAPRVEETPEPGTPA